METLLKYIKAVWPVENIIEWEHIDITGYNRLYFKPVDDQTDNGFFFYDVELTGGKMGGKEWDPEYTTVDSLYHGIAYFDGIRHLYMGSKFSDNEGYDYYPSLDTHIKVLTELKRLEEKYCPQKD